MSVSARFEELHAQAVKKYEAGRWEEAARLLSEALREDETSEAWSDWASVQYRLGRKEEAEAGYRAALGANAQDAQAATNLGVLLIEQGRKEEAAGLLERGRNGLEGEQRAGVERWLQEARKSGAPRAEAELERFLWRYEPEDPNSRAYFQTHLKRYVATLALLPDAKPGDRLLELGAAFHHLTPALIRMKGYADLRCTDVWEGEAQTTRTLTSRDGALQDEVVVDNFDLQSAPWPFENGSFDAVLCCEILEHLTLDPMGLLAEINRVLKPGGILLLTTPNLGSSHAVERALRAESPYCYGHFEVGGRTTDRHNREYTATEVATLAHCAGFAATALRTHDFYWPPKRETLRQLVSLGFPLALRGDSTFLLARKDQAVRERYPSEFYVTQGVQGARRERQGPGELTERNEEQPAVVSQNVLVVHEIVPHYDCSGADLRIFELLRELRREGHRVTLLARQDRNCEKYAPAVEKLGVTVIAGDPSRLRHQGDDREAEWSFRELLEKRGFDTAILCHWHWNGITLAEHYLDEIRRWSPSTCVLLLSEDRHGERERRAFQLSGHLTDLERGEDFEQREAEAYGRADAVLYVTEVDHRHHASLVKDLRAEHLPTIAETGTMGPGLAEREGVLFLGNFENLANREALRWLLKEVMPQVWSAEPGLRLYVAGNALTPDLCKPEKNIAVLGRIEDLGAAFAKRRIFVGPIRFGTGIITKNMIAMAHGLPVVTTTVGGEGLQLVDKEHALLADTAEAFAAAIVQVNRDEQLWNGLRDRGSAYIAANFNLDKLRAALRKILAMASALPRKHWEPDHEWSYRRVETFLPETLTQVPARYRPQLRALGYWQLGKHLLRNGEAREALAQFRHVFTLLRGQLPAVGFHIRLLRDMARAYGEMGLADGAARCDAEAGKLEEAARAPYAPAGNKQKSGETGKPLISVIIPTFNRKEILRLCLLGLSFQTLPSEMFEVIVVDDGSTDGTEAFLRETDFPFGPVRYLRQENAGAGAARRAGVEAARGDLVLFFNDDTVAMSTLLAEHAAEHRRNSKERVAILGTFMATEECNRHALSLWLQRSTFLFPQNALREGQLCDAAHFVTCNLSVPRKAVLEAGSFDPAFRVGEDTELGIRLAARGYRVKYHPAAQAIHEHARFTADNLVQRAKTYGPIHVALFEKHPHLVRNGNTPFGRLEAQDYARMEREVADKRPAVEAALAGLRALDGVDLFEANKKGVLNRGQLDDLLAQVAQLVPVVYWTTLFESFLEAGAAHAHAAGGKQG